MTVPAGVAEAAHRLINALASDLDFRAQVAKAEIDRQVAAGLLIPVERLQVAGGLVLVNASEVDDLRAVVDQARALWSQLSGRLALPELSGRAVSGLRDEMSDLLAPAAAPQVVPVPETPYQDTRNGNPGSPVASSDPVVATSRDGPDATSDPLAADRSSEPTTESIPTVDDHGPCASCGAEITEAEQALRSWTVTRLKLCRECLKGWRKQ